MPLCESMLSTGVFQNTIFLDASLPFSKIAFQYYKYNQMQACINVKLGCVDAF